MPAALMLLEQILPKGIGWRDNGRMPAHLMKQIYCGGLLYTNAQRAWNAMVHYASEDNIFLNLNSPVNAYRSIDLQRKIFLQSYTLDMIPDAPRMEFESQSWYLKNGHSFAQIPGKSAHGFGLAVDIANAVTSKAVSGWLPVNAKYFGWFHEYECEPWHLVYSLAEAVTDRVLAFEALPPKPQWTATQVEQCSEARWLNIPPHSWRCSGLRHSGPFRTGSLAVVDQGNGSGYTPRTIRNIFRQCAGLICSYPDDLLKFKRPLLISSDIALTLNRLSLLFDQE